MLVYRTANTFKTLTVERTKRSAFEWLSNFKPKFQISNLTWMEAKASGSSKQATPERSGTLTENPKAADSFQQIETFEEDDLNSIRIQDLVPMNPNLDRVVFPIDKRKRCTCVRSKCVHKCRCMRAHRPCTSKCKCWGTMCVNRDPEDSEDAEVKQTKDKQTQTDKRESPTSD